MFCVGLQKKTWREDDGGLMSSEGCDIRKQQVEKRMRKRIKDNRM
jgi:hypothetical protein